MSVIIDEVKPTTKPSCPIFGDPVQVEEMLHADTLAVERKYQAAIDEIEAEKVAIERRIEQHRRRYKEINEEISELKGEQERLRVEGIDSKNEVRGLEEEQRMLNERMEYAVDHLVPDDFVDPPYGAPLTQTIHPDRWPDPPYGAPLTGDARTQRAYAGGDEDVDDFDRL